VIFGMKNIPDLATPALAGVKRNGKKYLPLKKCSYAIIKKRFIDASDHAIGPLANLVAINFGRGKFLESRSALIGRAISVTG
jgi:hypothetical protein